MTLFSLVKEWKHTFCFNTSCLRGLRSQNWTVLSAADTKYLTYFSFKWLAHLLAVLQPRQQLLCSTLFVCCHPVVVIPQKKIKIKTHLSWWPHSSWAPDKDIEAVAPLILQPALRSTFPNQERWHCYRAQVFMDTLKALFCDVLHLFLLLLLLQRRPRQTIAVCMCVCTSLSDGIVSSVCAPQGDVELESSGGAKRSAAVRRLGTPGSATGKKLRFQWRPPPGLIAASWRWCFKVKSQAILTVFHLAFWNWSWMESTLKNTKKTQTKINGITNTERIWLCREGNQVQNKCSHASSSACSF